ncbi:MAG TPA: septum formation initiator family protein [Candidatus Eisenbacteria bacterium]|nr:septum formation initiator family protein [Candidatus Eisenbacteria bacterium]
MKRIVFAILVVFLIGIIVNLSISIVTLWSKKDLLTIASKQLEKERKENTRLHAEIRRVEDPSFIEEEARDKLFLGKPGDVIVLIPTASPSASEEGSMQEKPIWQQWWELFF